MKRLCPCCNFQGVLFHATIVATGEQVVVCDECEALWKKDVDISEDTCVGLSSYLKSLGLLGRWAELHVEDSDSV